jgi:hypothetical protein
VPWVTVFVGSEEQARRRRERRRRDERMAVPR